MSIREGPIPDGSPFQFRLRSLFHLMTVAATVSALGHYFGEIVLHWLAIGVFLMIALAFVTLGPALVTEVLTLIIDKSLVVVGAASWAPHKRLAPATRAAGQHDVAGDSDRQCLAQMSWSGDVGRSVKRSRRLVFPRRPRRDDDPGLPR
ncbi:MAG: hypothetical protein KJ000_02660 [Pirellulaceae bacterium]|nr:hypothetical protein [Pirellulaceae bacterium]